MVPSIVRSGTCLIEFALVTLCVAWCELIANHVTRYSPTHSVLVKGPTMDIVCYSSFVRLFGVICPRTLAIEIDPTYLVHEISRSKSILPIWCTRPRDRDRSYLFGLKYVLDWRIVVLLIVIYSSTVNCVHIYFMCLHFPPKSTSRCSFLPKSVKNFLTIKLTQIWTIKMILRFFKIRKDTSIL